MMLQVAPVSIWHSVSVTNCPVSVDKFKLTNSCLPGVLITETSSILSMGSSSSENSSSDSSVSCVTILTFRL